MRRICPIVFLLLLALPLLAESNEIKQFLADFKQLGGTVTLLEEQDHYMRASLNDSTTIEIFDCPPDLCDKWFVIITTCAPQCSSCARVYNKEGKFLFPLEPPFRSIFPLASIDKNTGRITWTDNDTWEY